ncbi:MAG: alpha/beta hydrolase [Oscillospiraceae bacterium]|nr:alpha/beta hydrolase [Oscillospiraceae bacterium]
MPLVKTSDGININYTEYNEYKNSEPLLLIMGLGAPGSLWEKHIGEYKKYFRCIAIDNRGAGESGKPAGDYRTDQMADDAISVADALGIDEFQINGISMGGAIAQKIAINHAARVKGCVITASWAFCGNYMKSVFEMLKITRGNMSYANFSRMFLLWLYSAKYYESDFCAIEESIQNNIDDLLPMPRHAFESQASACQNHDTRESLNAVTAPVLITAGSADIFTPVECSAYLHKNIKNSELAVFEGYAHTHHWEDLNRYNALTANFLRRNI